MDFTQPIGELTTLKKNTDSAVKLLRAIARLEQNRLQNLPELRKQLTQLDQLISQLSQKAETLEVLRNWADGYRGELLSAEQEFKKQFGGALEQELKKKGLSLSGQYPDLKAGLFTIELDFDRGDETSSITYLMTDGFIAEHAAFLYSTLSSISTAPRSRVIFILDRPYSDAEGYRQARLALIHKYPE